MSAVAEIRYVALKPLVLQSTEGERLEIAPGEAIPESEVGRWVELAVEAGKVTAAVASDASSLTDAELRTELEARGYKVTKPTRKAA